MLIIGAGGLGSPAALYLAAGGVGRIGIVDQDVVELSNLHRQIIHNEAHVGVHKAESAKEACKGLNSSVQVIPADLLRKAMSGLSDSRADDYYTWARVIWATKNITTVAKLRQSLCTTSKHLCSCWEVLQSANGFLAGTSMALCKSAL